MLTPRIRERISFCVLAVLVFSLPILPAAADDAHLAAQLHHAYPATNMDFRDGLLVVNGKAITFNDGRIKNLAEQLADADVEDMFSIPYPPPKALLTVPQQGADPGRIRCRAFFAAMYGETAREVERSLVSITWLPHIAPTPIRVTTINGVAEKLVAISEQIERLPEPLRRFAYHPAGGYSQRMIAGTDQPSPHSYGIAIDLNVRHAHYWRWRGLDKHANNIPQEIVDIFESHGFIWGGRWYHYDTMHFEYRPELLIAKPVDRSKWNEDI